MKIRTTLQNLPFYQSFLKVESAAHEFFKKHHYLRLDLPVLSPALIPESSLEVFETEFGFFERREKLYLTPSPELFIKRLLAEGIGDCYYLGKAFRNAEPSSRLHGQEFTMLEFYKVGVDYSYLKKETRRLLVFICQKLFGTTRLTVKGQVIDVGRSWEETTVAQAFTKYAGIQTDELFHQSVFIKKAQKKGYQIKNSSYIDLYSQIYTQEIEPHLGVNGRPTIITDYPKEMAALAKLNSDGKTAQRFEFYIAGVELGDCYTELTDWAEQKERFQKEDYERRKTGRIIHPVDWGLIESLKKGLPACSGIAIGFDRLAMLFAGCEDIQQLQLIQILPS